MHLSHVPFLMNDPEQLEGRFGTISSLGGSSGGGPPAAHDNDDDDSDDENKETESWFAGGERRFSISLEYLWRRSYLE